MPYDGLSEGRAYVTLPRVRRDPIALPLKGKLYTKTVAGVVQLFYMASDGTISTLSPISGAPVTSVFGRNGAVIATLGDYVASLVSNDSVVSGATVADALDALDTALGALSTDDILNNSTAAGATATDALDAIDAFLDALSSDDVANNSNVSGTSVSDALDALLTGSAPVRLGIDTRNATHVVTAADINRMQEFTAAGAVNLTINNNILQAGDVVPFVQIGNGVVTVNGTATPTSRGNLLSTNGVGAYCGLIMRSATEVLVVGDRA